MDWKGRKVLVTGGASFIGSHLVDALVERGAKVRVVDNLSSGRIENIQRNCLVGNLEYHLWRACTKRLTGTLPPKTGSKCGRFSVGC